MQVRRRIVRGPYHRPRALWHPQGALRVVDALPDVWDAPPVTHDKRHLVKPTILTQTRYIGFNREPVRNDGEQALIQHLPSPAPRVQSRLEPRA